MERSIFSTTRVTQPAHAENTRCALAVDERYCPSKLPSRE
jgi:hypothetical protein